MTKITRISTTITARYTPSGGATDAFWLDSRMPGPRDVRASDITLDREDKGFFFSVFAAPSISKDTAYDLEAVKPVLEKMHMDIKHSAKNIDNLIVDFAECSTGVVGKKTIALDGIKHPYFAGIVVKNGEIAAVTTGRGCAYLYRNEALYPLTHNDLGFEAIDFSGRNIPNIDVYCAGTVGNVHYSNIAQLQVDDCIIVCNKELLSAIGQTETLRILNEAYDQADAAGMLITEAASKLPGTTIQIMIGFVESISEAGKQFKQHVIAPIPVIPMRGKPIRGETARGIIPRDDSDKIIVANEGDFDEDEDFDDEYEDSGVAKKIGLTAVILVVVAASAFAIWWAFFKDAPGPIVSSSLSSVSSISLSSSEVSNFINSSSLVSTTDPTPTTAVTSGPASTIIATHTIKSGETIYQIAQQYYGSTADKYTSAIVNENVDKYPTFTLANYGAGWIIDIPKVD